jgi:uncharacterized protein (TIGR03118 family)
MKTNLFKSSSGYQPGDEQVNVAYGEKDVNGGNFRQRTAHDEVGNKHRSHSKSVIKRVINSRLLHSFTVLMVLATVSTSCDELFDELNNPPHVASASYKQTILVSDTAGFNAMRIDPTLVNAWGIAINPNGIPWISSNGKGLSEVYDKNGVPKRAPVAIPSQGMLNGGTPSGVIFNKTSDFVIPATGQVSKFIFAGEDGKLYAWSSGDSTRTVVDRSAWGAVYKGIEQAMDGNANFLYTTDFHNGKVDVFDKNFMPVTTKPFNDPKIPMGFAPFNIRLIDGWLYVTYAKQHAPDNHDDEAGPGNGYIDIFKTDGTLIKRFVSKGKLNSPWGIEKAPEGFGQGKNVILVGNFGDGHINVYENPEGEFLRQLKYNGMPVWIDGLWAITFPDNNIPGDNPNKLYFTAGPDDESHGLFGYLLKQ